MRADGFRKRGKRRGICFYRDLQLPLPTARRGHGTDADIVNSRSRGVRCPTQRKKRVHRVRRGEHDNACAARGQPRLERCRTVLRKLGLVNRDVLHRVPPSPQHLREHAAGDFCTGQQDPRPRSPQARGKFRGEPLAVRLQTAVRAGAFACTGSGDWESAPRRRDLERLGASGDPVIR